MCALITSLLITPLLADNLSLTWILFVIFTVMHVYSNYQAVSCVVMDTFNRLRFDSAVKYFSAKKMLTPEEANFSEPLVKVTNYQWLKLGCKIEDLKMSEDELSHALSLCELNNHKFLIKHDKHKGMSIWIFFDVICLDYIYM